MKAQAGRRRITIRLDEDLYRNLCTAARREGLAPIALARQIVRSGLSVHQGHWRLDERVQELMRAAGSSELRAAEAVNNSRSSREAVEALAESLLPLVAETLAINRELAQEQSKTILPEAQRKALALIRLLTRDSREGDST
jgi:hypothetical protein